MSLSVATLRHGVDGKQVCFVLTCSDVDSVFSIDLGNLYKASSKYSKMRIHWRTVPSAHTG